MKNSNLILAALYTLAGAGLGYHLAKETKKGEKPYKAKFGALAGGLMGIMLIHTQQLIKDK